MIYDFSILALVEKNQADSVEDHGILVDAAKSSRQPQRIKHY